MQDAAAGARHVAIGDVIVGGLVSVLGLVGLVMASKALDDEIFIFGIGTALFAVLFDFGLIKAHFDRKDG